MGSRLSGNCVKKLVSRPTTKDFIDINIQSLHRNGKLNINTIFWQNYYGLRLEVEVNATGLKLTSRNHVNKTFIQYVYIDRCGSRLSSNRVWMLCPRFSCNKRVASLYFKDGFYCRHCLGLSYDSQKMSNLQRHAAEYQQLEKRLTMFDGYCIRPKGMHHKTYLPLARRAKYLYKRVFGPANRAMQRVRDLDAMSDEELKAEFRKNRKTIKRQLS